jgi:DNA-directed RNA polymerase II subunit RPB2
MTTQYIEIKQMDTKDNKMTNSNSDQMVTSDELHTLIQLYFKQPNILYNHQYNSFNQLVDEYIPYILKKEDNVFFSKLTSTHMYNYKFMFDNIRLKPPTMDNENELLFPSTARLMNLTYSAKLIANITQIQEKINITTKEKEIKIIGEKENEYHVTNIPIMLKSKYCNLNDKKNRNIDTKECKYDPGAYFIVKGSEKLVISLERMVDNKPLVFIKKDQMNKIYTVQINSKNHDTDISQTFTIRYNKSNKMILKIPQFNEIPIFILIRALGIETDKDIINYIVGNNSDVDMINIIRISLESTETENKIKITTQEEAINYMINKIRSYKKYTETNIENKILEKKLHLNHILTNDILPHMGKNLLKKGYYICYMINKLLSVVLGRRDIDDRDSFINKRVDTPGVLIGMLFKQYFKKMLNECNKFFRKRNTDDENPLNIINQIKSNIIEQGILSALSTGTWGGMQNKKGVAQVLMRISYFKVIGDLRRISSPSSGASGTTLTGPRHIHNSQFGVLCPIESPEGANVGLQKNLALMGSVTLMVKSQIRIIRKFINNYLIDIQDIHPYNFNKNSKIFINGEWLGFTNLPIELVNKMRNLRISGELEKTVSIQFHTTTNEIHINCDNGRLFRPLLRVVDNDLLINSDMIKNIAVDSNNINKIYKWSNFINKYKGVIEYIDVDEAHEMMIAMYPKDVYKMKKLMNNYNVDDELGINRYDNNIFVRYTHCELHPSMMLGSVASSIPFCNHNQAPRCIFQFAQLKQSLGLYTTTYRHRQDASYILYNTQIPLLTTRSIEYTNCNKMVSGENLIVAICSYTGYNQEDSIIINQSAVERGLLRANAYKKHTEIISKNPSTSQDDIFTKPDRNKVIGTKSGSYDKLNEQGYVPEETKVSYGDIIIGKISPIQQTSNNNKAYKDSSTPYKSHVPGYVEKVWTGLYTGEGYEMYKMKIRCERIPKIGDKFCSRHGQKGTIGLTLKQEDMPFTEDGITPDIIINPHCIPSRMTIGQLVECLIGKVAALNGHESDATPFNILDMESIKKELSKHGFNETGKEYLYNGMNGQKMSAMIFIGPTYYQRLKHMVDDKIHSRARGPRQQLTRQPPEGRTRDGGLRFGEMERDCVIAHGMSQFLKERMVEASDLYSIHVCDVCGFFAQQMLGSPGIYYCPKCDNTTDISKVNITYAFKLLVQELMSMNIAPRIRVKKDIYTDLV